MKPYRSALWHEYRRKVITADGGVCHRCRRSESEGAVLQVHHKSYLTGLQPWEYPLQMCETLCKGCHAETHGIIPPKSNWDYLGYDDLGDQGGTCEYCGNTIRYVFLIQHPNWRLMEVGIVCCNHLTSTETASRFVDSQRRYSDKLKRFISSKKWILLSNGISQIYRKKIFLEIVPIQDYFKIKINGKLGKLQFPSEFEAKVQAFRLIESGEVDRYLNRIQGKKTYFFTPNTKPNYQP